MSNLRIFFNHGEVMIVSKVVKLNESGAFQKVKFKIFLNHGEVKEHYRYL